MTRIEIPVKGMHCEGCQRTLSLALTRLEGVREAKADRNAQKLTVHYDPEQVDEQTLREHVELCGYEVVRRKEAGTPDDALA